MDKGVPLRASDSGPESEPMEFDDFMASAADSLGSAVLVGGSSPDYRQAQRLFWIDRTIEALQRARELA